MTTPFDDFDPEQQPPGWTVPRPDPETLARYSRLPGASAGPAPTRMEELRARVARLHEGRGRVGEPWEIAAAFFGPRVSPAFFNGRASAPFTSLGGAPMREAHARVTPAEGDWAGFAKRADTQRSRGQPLTIGDLVKAPEYEAAYPGMLKTPVAYDINRARHPAHWRKGTYGEIDSLKVDIGAMKSMPPQAIEYALRRALQQGAYHREGMAPLNSVSGDISDGVAKGATQALRRIADLLEAGAPRDRILAMVGQKAEPGARHILDAGMTPVQMRDKAAYFEGLSGPKNPKEAEMLARRGGTLPDYVTQSGPYQFHIRPDAYQRITQGRNETGRRTASEIEIDEAVKRDMSPALRQGQPLETARQSPLDIFVPFGVGR